MNVQFTDDIAALIERIRALAIAARVDAYAVGGSVRDALLGRVLHDLDIAVDRDALAFGRRLAGVLGGHFVELDDVHAIARVVVDDGPVAHIDVAQLQGTLEADLRRRDFTIDALAVRLGEAAVVDITGGVDDLAARIVRMNGDRVFDDDPLRLLRAVRIASELGFDIDAATEAAIYAGAATLLKSARERQRDELARLFVLGDVYGAVRLLGRVGLLDVLLPEMSAGRGVTQPGGFHAYDVFEHNLRAVEAMDVMLAPTRPERLDAWLWDDFWMVFGWNEPALRTYLSGEMSEGRSRAALLKFAALLHDVAKPQARTLTDDGNAHFLGHADLGAKIASKIMRRFRFSSSEMRFVSVLVAEHLRPGQLALPGEVPTRRALYRFYRALGDAMPAVILLALADAASARGLAEKNAAEASEAWMRHVRYMNSALVRSIEEEGILDPPRLLTGVDVMRHLGLAEGPLIGTLLEAVREAQAAGEVSDVEQALGLARRLVDEASRTS